MRDGECASVVAQGVRHAQQHETAGDYAADGCAVSGGIETEGGVN